MSMRRADRRDDSHDNSVRNPRSQQSEPISYHELKTRFLTVQSQKNELQENLQEAKQKVEQTHRLYQEEQQRYHSTLTLYQEEQQKYQSTLVLYQEVQTQAQSYLTLYEQEKNRSSELQLKYETAQTERDQYLTLYNDAQSQLQFERRSKAGIKGWETRRKRENELLKQEIAEMTVLLRDSLAHKEEAIGHLEELANRMDRIQHLVDSVESNSTDNPIGLLQKFKRIWQAIQDILAE